MNNILETELKKDGWIMLPDGALKRAAKSSHYRDVCMSCGSEVPHSHYEWAAAAWAAIMATK